MALSLLVLNASLLTKLRRACKRAKVALTQQSGSTLVVRPVVREFWSEQLADFVKRTVWETAPADRYTVDGFPGVPGYEFVCRIEHAPAGNLIAGPGSVEGWREAKPTCDHCQKSRKRADTFVLRRTEDGALMRVGRNCLADFLRTDPTDLVHAADVYQIIRDEDFCGGSAKWEHPIDVFVACAIRLIKLEGWRKADQCPSTKSRAWFATEPKPTTARMAEDWQALQPTEADFSRAAEVLAWIGTLDAGSSDYLHNLKVSAAQRGVTERTSGILASASQAYDRAMGQQAERAARPVSAHVGAPGERLTLDVECVLVRELATDDYSRFAAPTLYKFRDVAGNELAWFASSTPKVGEEYLSTGHKVTLKGTVKKHEEYKGQKQTILSRCKVISQ